MILGPSGVLLAQPQGYAEIDWSNPDTQGLVGFYIVGPTTTYDLVTLVERNTTGLTNTQKLHVVGRSGYSMNGVASSTAHENWPSPLSPSLPQGATVLAQGRAFSTPGANQNLISLASATITGNAFFIGSPASGALGRVRLLVTNDGGNTRLDITSAAEIFTGNTSAHTVVGTFSHPTGLQGTVFADGALIASGSGTAGGPFTYETVGLNSAKRASITRGWRGELYLGAVWNRSLPPDAAARVSANPWALLRHSPRRVWVGFGAGGGAGVSAASSIAIGQIAASATAQLLVRAESAVALGAISAVSAVEVRVSAQSAVSLAGIATSATVAVPLSATSAIALGDIASQASAVVGSPPIIAASAIAIGELTVAADAAVEVRAAALVAIAPITNASAAALAVRAQSAVQLSSITAQAAAVFGDPPFVAASSIALGLLGTASHMTSMVAGASSTMLGAIVHSSAAQITVPAGAFAAAPPRRYISASRPSSNSPAR